MGLLEKTTIKAVKTEMAANKKNTISLVICQG
jgi:hypothetical protein